MQLSNTPTRFGLFSRLLHWLLAGLMIGLIWLGWYMVDMNYYDKWYKDALHYHKSLGMLILILATVKIGWQRYTPEPAPLPGLRTWEQTAARTMHRLLWATLLLLPVTGYLISTSAGQPVQLFNWLAIPAIVDIDEKPRELAITTHCYLAYATLLLAAAHAGAAIKHHIINRDNTLKRMLWGAE